MRVATRTVLFVAALALAAGAPAADTPQGFVELFKAATEAHGAKDYARMERLLRDALALRPGHPTAQYNLAAALALRGEKGDALDALGSLARMGLSFDPASDPDFAALREGFRFGLLKQDFSRNRKAVGDADVSFTVPAASFIPEGIAYDGDTRSFFLGSVHERRILRIRRDGKQDNFAADGPLWAVLGMTADVSRRRLWVATAAIPEMKNAAPDELGRTAILAYDLDSGELKQKHPLPQDGRKHVFGDLIVARSGAVYATDSGGGGLYALDPATGNFTLLTAPGELTSPQGLALARDRRTLYVADYTQGLFRYDLDKRALKRMEVARDICVYGIDGLYRFDDDLVAVQNGVRPHRAVRFELDRAGRRVRHAQVLAANLREFDEPTLGVVVGKRFHFVANSQWNKFGKDHALPPAEQLRGPIVLEVALDRRDPRRDEPRRGPAQPQQQPAPLELPPVGLPPIR